MTKQTEDKKEQRAREGAQAWAEYQAEGRAAREKTARLRALRLARDAADSNVAEPKKKKLLRCLWQLEEALLYWVLLLPLYLGCP